MGVYRLILTALALGIGAGVYWMTGRWLALYGLPAGRWPIRLVRLAGSALVLGLCALWRTVGLAAVYLTAIFALTEALAALVRRWARRSQGAGWYRALRRVYRTGLVPVLVCALVLGWGAWNMAHIVRTEYTVVSHKLTRDLDVVFLSDCHYDTIQSPRRIAGMAREIGALGADVIILGGDIVEEGTTKEAMEEVFRVLGGIESTYGTYFVYGNHDRQRYSQRPAYSEEELAAALEEGGVTALRDQWTELGEELILAGREDASSPGRQDAGTLLAGADRDRFILAADHQPVGSEENGAAGVDLQLSGHTHAGQIFPVGLFTALSGQMNYGLYQAGDCAVIVSSGTTGWGFPIRTQGPSEYVLVRLRAAD